MSDPAGQPWNPSTFLEYIRHVETSTGPAEIETDAGRALIKALGNKEGPHVLACEWVGTKLAAWFGLPTFDIAIMRVTAADEIPMGHGRRAEPGPAIVLRWEKGGTWGATPKALGQIDNPQAIARMVVFDTWTCNCDRHPADLTTRRPNRDNVFLSEEGATPGRFILKAIDHTHCFTCGRDLTRNLANIGRVQDPGIYGLFPEFSPYVDRQGVRSAVERLRQVDEATAREPVNSIPREWDVTQATRNALTNLIRQRATFVADNIMNALAVPCDWGLDFEQSEEGGGP